MKQLFLLQGYPTQLTRAANDSWKQFWYAPADDRVASYLRIVIALICLAWLYSFSPDLADWYGEQGIASREIVRNYGSGLLASSLGEWRFSLLEMCRTDGQLRIAHAVSLGIVASFGIGFLTRWMGLGSLIVISSFVQRAPFLFGLTEHVMIFALLYLNLAQCGHYMSLDAWLKKPKLPTGEANEDRLSTRSIGTNVAIRLIQIHLSLIFMYSALSKLSGDVWWDGEAVWWMLVQPQSTLVDFTWLGEGLIGELLMNFWTYAIVATELAAAVLIWRPMIRPIVVFSVFAIYCSLIPLTALVGYCGLIAILTSTFLWALPQQRGSI